MLDVTAALRVDVGGQSILVSAAGNKIVAETMHPERILGTFGSPVRARALAIVLARKLADYGLTLTVVRRGRTVAMLGANARPTIFARLLRMPKISLFPRDTSR